MSKFQKPFIANPNILKPKPGNPLGYCTNDGMWAAIPFGKKFIIIHNGEQVKVLNTYKQSIDFINNQLKTIKRKKRK
jgi:hypothetical protein|tara:strand:- start:289 stop:519 length:231 start_codon:yes stop_codon:yes gene_type:complete